MTEGTRPNKSVPTNGSKFLPNTRVETEREGPASVVHDRNKGWVHIRFDDGREKHVRPSTLHPLDASSVLEAETIQEPPTYPSHQSNELSTPVAGRTRTQRRQVCREISPGYLPGPRSKQGAKARKAGKKRKAASVSTGAADAGHDEEAAEDEEELNEGEDDERPTKQRRRHPWTAREEKVLEAGVKQYGEGAWAKILKDPIIKSGFHAGRTNVHLKDKWRNLQKQVQDVTGVVQRAGPKPSNASASATVEETEAGRSRTDIKAQADHSRHPLSRKADSQEDGDELEFEVLSGKCLQEMLHASKQLVSSTEPVTGKNGHCLVEDSLLHKVENAIRKLLALEASQQKASGNGNTGDEN